MDSENNFKIDISDKIQEQLKHDKVKMRSKWYFILEKIGIEGGIVICIVLTIIFLSLAIFILQEKGLLEFTEFGLPGWAEVLKNIPYEIIGLSIVFFIIANFLIKQFDFSYRKPFYIISIGVMALVAILGFVSFWTGFSKSVYNGGIAKISNYYENKIAREPASTNAIIGRVVKCGPNTILIETPQRKFIQVKYTSANMPKNAAMFEGEIIKILGRVQGEVFTARFIKAMKQTDIKYLKPLPKPTPAATCSN